MTSTRAHRPWALLLALVLTFGLAVAVPDTATAESSEFPSVGTDFEDPGPYDVTRLSTSDHTYFHPSDLGADGVRHPVILWGNGTGASPRTYRPLLEHLASHGFIVAAADTGYAGSGRAMLEGLDNLERWNAAWWSRFNGVVDLDRVGSTGHSQGGGGAIQTGQDPRVGTVFPLQPWRGDPDQLEIPALFFAGEDDGIVSARSVRRAYRQAQGPAAYAELANAGHFVPTGDAGAYRRPATAWARWYLMGDDNAEGVFVGSGCDLCYNGWFATWSDYRTNDAFDAAPGPQ